MALENPNRGYLYERIESHPHEKALAEEWQERCRQDFLCHIINSEPSRRDAYVAASVIQWLGTNVGFAFIQTAFRKVGYVVLGDMPQRPFTFSFHDEPLIKAIQLAEINQSHFAACTKAAAAADQLLFDLCEPS